MNDVPRVVYDCNILLQALGKPAGPSGICVQLAFDGLVHLYISKVVLDELRDVATRPKVVRKLNLTSERVEAFINALERTATELVNVPESFTYDRDPDDAHYVNLALAAGATLIVSRDKDLLDLMDANAPEAAAFQTRFPSLRILDPVTFLHEAQLPPTG